MNLVMILLRKITKSTINGVDTADSIMVDVAIFGTVVVLSKAGIEDLERSMVELCINVLENKKLLRF